MNNIDTAHSDPGPALDVKVDYLSRPDSYAENPAQVETIETHMSWVFMTERFVYKLKKPVRHSFLDFSTLDARHKDCQEEVRLNRRLAPEIYLGTVPLTLDDNEHLHLDGKGEAVDWLVNMRRLPANRMLDKLIENQQVEEREVRNFSRKLANFYQNALPVSITPEEYRQRLLHDINSNHQDLLDHDYNLPTEKLERINEAQLNLLDRQQELFDRRVEDKRIIEAHGDLRPEHICLLDEPVFIDCLEFNRDLRILDPAHELAYLTMECEFAGATFINPLVFETYRQTTGDHPAQILIHFYKTYRAALRAKLSIWHIKDHEADEHSRWVNRAEAYLQLAEEYSRLL